MSTAHPDFDALSAHLDGEAPEWESHVAACAACRSTLDRLRTASALVARPVAPASAAVRERGLARALAEFGRTESGPDTTESVAGLPPAPATRAAGGAGAAEHPPAGAAAGAERSPAGAGAGAERSLRPAAAGSGPGPATPISSARRWRRGSGLWIGAGSAAAVLVAFLVGVGVLAGGGGGGGGDNTVAAGSPPTQEGTVAARADDSGSIASSPIGGAAGAVAGGTDGGDLGDIADAPTLAARARPVLQKSGAQPTADATNPRLAPTAAGALSPQIAGTRPCEMEARTERPDLGTVVYFATGRVQGTPVVVLGFAAGPAPAPVTLLALAQPEGCRIVLEAAGP
jgi:hypothetical protein